MGYMVALLNNVSTELGALSALYVGPDSKCGENFAMVMPTPQLATNRHMLGSFSYLLQYLVYVLISQ